MLNRSFIFFLAAAACFVTTSVVVLLVLDLHLKQTNASTSTAVPSRAGVPEPFKTAHAANQTTTRILALDQAKRLTFWTMVLKNKKQACDVVVRTMYQGGTEAGVDSWSIGCQDGSKFSISISPDAQESACTRDTFARRAE